MKLVLRGNINKTYVQTLCMMFFHGEKFPEKEDFSQNVAVVEQREFENRMEATCQLTYGGKTAIGSAKLTISPETNMKRASKAAVGRAVYEAGKKITGKEIPWGILTGIRPSKIANEILKETSFEVALTRLTQDYLLSERKAELCLKVAKNEYSIIESYGENTCSIYISIPFCPTRCTYCSFISYATKKLLDLIPSYLSAIIDEFDKKLELINNFGLKLVTVYIGGGTPTTLNEEQLEFLLQHIASKVEVSALHEFTVECGRPDTITLEKLHILERYGVNRISVNPQTLNDEVLKNIGRRHTVQDFFNAYNLAKNNTEFIINVDLIAGLEDDNIESFKNTIDSVISLDPDNITVHTFSVKKSAQALENNKDIYNMSDNSAIDSVDYAYGRLTSSSYEPYYMYRQKNTVSDLENVGYSKKNCFSIYNILMMSDSHTVFGVGAGATTKLVLNKNDKREILRIFSPKYPYEYLKNKDYKLNDILSFYEEV